MTQKFNGSSVIIMGKLEYTARLTFRNGNVRTPNTETIWYHLNIRSHKGCNYGNSDKIKGSDMGPLPQRVMEVVNRI